jgi:hypothetical protein
MAATLLLALLLAACATTGPDLPRLATRAAEAYGPACRSAGPTNTQAWGQCVARAYDRAVARHGGSCSDWQLTKAASFQDCVITASAREATSSGVVGAGPYCIAMDVGGGIDFSNCR